MIKAARGALIVLPILWAEIWALEPAPALASFQDNNCYVATDTRIAAPIPNGGNKGCKSCSNFIGGCLAETGHGPQEQIPLMGCSIKWKH